MVTADGWWAAAGEDDLEILTTTQLTWTRQLQPWRAGCIFIGLQPGWWIRPLEDHRAPRTPGASTGLYQALNFLLRDYGFDLEDLPFTREGRLPLEHDPKPGLGQTRTCVRRPVELNKADRQTFAACARASGPQGRRHACWPPAGRAACASCLISKRLGISASRAGPVSCCLDGPPNRRASAQAVLKLFYAPPNCSGLPANCPRHTICLYFMGLPPTPAHCRHTKNRG